MSIKCRLDIKKDIIDSVIKKDLQTKNIKRISQNEVFVPVRAFGTLETTYNVAKDISSKANKKYQEEIQYIDKKTNKKSNFMTLSPLQRATFVSVVIQQINQESKKMQKAWENELDKKFTSKNKIGRAHV